MRTRDMTCGHPLKLIVSFSLPLMLGNVFQQLYTMVDTVIVGRGIGVSALAAVGVSDWLTYFVLSIVQGLAQGFSIKMAQDFGAQDEKELKRGIGASIVMAALVAALMTVMSFAMAIPALRLMRTPDDIFPMSMTYVSVIFAGIPIVMAYNLSASILRAVGDSRSPLYAMLAASLLNVALDLLFVMGFRWGVGGAAAATVIAQMTATALCLISVRRIPVLRIGKGDLRWNGALNWHLFKLGAPMALQNAIIAVGGVVVQSVVNGFGVLFIAGFTATNKLYGLLEIAATSFGYAFVTYAGQNLGAKKYQRIRDGIRYGMILSIGVSLFIAVCMLIFGRFILAMFISGTPDEVRTSIEIGYRYLSVMSVGLPILYILYVLRSTIQGMGDTFLPMISGFAELIMRVLSAIVLPMLVGSTGIFFAEIAAWSGADVVLIAAAIKHMRQIRRLEKE